MANYKYKIQGKTRRDFAESSKHKLKGTIELAPNIGYRHQGIYKLSGLRSGVFNGDYRFYAITKRIDENGYSVTAEGMKIYRKKVSKKRKVTTSSKKKKSSKPRTKASYLYTVKSGDTLIGISIKLTGSSRNWTKIEKANHEKLIKRDKRNNKQIGHWIYPGQKLTIPPNVPLKKGVKVWRS